LRGGKGEKVKKKKEIIGRSSRPPRDKRKPEKR